MIFEDIQAFVNVARCGGFSRAADAMSVAQSALSKRVQRLEQRVGTQLLQRLPRGIALTEAGLAFLHEAQAIVDKIEDIDRNLSSYVLTPSGRVRVAMPLRTCALLAPGLLQRCKQELPLVNLELMEGTPSESHAHMSSGNADIALVYYDGMYNADFDAQPLMSEALYLISPKNKEFTHLKTAEFCKIQDLAHIPLILPPRPSSLRGLVERLCHGHGVRPHIIYEVDGTHTIRSLVASGMGATIFSQSVWSSISEKTLLDKTPFSSPMMKWQLLRVRRRGSHQLAIHRVSHILEEEFESLFAQGLWPGAVKLLST